MNPLKSRVAAIAIAAIGFSVSSASIAQPAQIEINANEDYEHEWTGITLPASLRGMKREFVHEYQERGSNIGSQYVSGADIFLTIYIYRHGAGDATLWHDRTLYTMKAREELGGFPPESWRTHFLRQKAT